MRVLEVTAQGMAMRSFSELTAREKQIEILRWICVVPMAIAGDSIGSLFVRAALWGIGYRHSGDRDALYWLVMIAAYAIPKAAFVVFGAKTAPRRQVSCAIGLLIAGFVLSLLIHVIAQSFASNRVGFTNYAHLFAQSMGLVIGVALVGVQAARESAQHQSSPSS